MFYAFVAVIGLGGIIGASLAAFNAPHNAVSVWMSQHLPKFR
jgi:predicted ribosomally synthesized peptide with SipW-like signal peptide